MRKARRKGGLFGGGEREEAAPRALALQPAGSRGRAQLRGRRRAALPGSRGSQALGCGVARALARDLRFGDSGGFPPPQESEGELLGVCHQAHNQAQLLRVTAAWFVQNRALSFPAGPLPRPGALWPRGATDGAPTTEGGQAHPLGCIA